jgi:hypothetical protein
VDAIGKGSEQLGRARGRGGAIPVCCCREMRTGGVEPPPLAGQDPKSCASAGSATFAWLEHNAGPERWRTRGLPGSSPRRSGRQVRRPDRLPARYQPAHRGRPRDRSAIHVLHHGGPSHEEAECPDQPAGRGGVGRRLIGGTHRDAPLGAWSRVRRLVRPPEAAEASPRTGHLSGRVWIRMPARGVDRQEERPSG